MNLTTLHLFLWQNYTAVQIYLQYAVHCINPASWHRLPTSAIFTQLPRQKYALQSSYKISNLTINLANPKNCSYQARNEPREVDLIDAGELTDDAGCENDDENEDDEDVLMFLPSNAFEKASRLENLIS